MPGTTGPSWSMASCRLKYSWHASRQLLRQSRQARTRGGPARSRIGYALSAPAQEREAHMEAAMEKYWIGRRKADYNMRVDPIEAPLVRLRMTEVCVCVCVRAGR